MDDDRGPDRRSSPDSLTTRKRKASRGLRVPHDPVPRGSSPDVARVSIAGDREIDEFGDKVTQVEKASDSATAIIERASADVLSVPSAPVVPVDLAAVQENEHAATTEDAPALPPAIPSDPPIALTTPLPTISGPPRPKPTTGASRVISVSDEPGSAVRQVRRRIRSIGEGERPESVHPPAMETVSPSADEGPELAQVDEVEDFVEAHDDVEAEPVAAAAPSLATPPPPPRPLSVPPPPIAASTSAPPPAPSPALSASAPSLDTQLDAGAPSIETVSVEAEDDELVVESEPSAPAVSAASATPAPTAQPDELAAKALAEEDDGPDVVADVEEDDDGATASDSESDADLEVEDSTEELTIPAEVAEKAPTSAPPPRASMPDVSRPPPPPRASAPDGSRPSAPPPETSRPTMVSPDAKPRRRHWWEEIFNDDYLRTQRKYTPTQASNEGDFIEASLGVEKGASVLDVGCGVGRQAVELATRGYEVLGVDLSLAMLSRASDAAQARGAKLNFLHADMGEMEFHELFDAAYCVGSTFGFFDDEKNADVIQRMHAALKPGGTLLLEVVNRDYAAEQHPAMVWYEAEGCVCMEETTFNWFTSRLEGKRTLLLEDGRQREQKFSMRIYSLHELGKLLHTAGFRVIEVSGHQKTPGAFFGANSRMLIILAQKRGADS